MSQDNITRLLTRGGMLRGDVISCACSDVSFEALPGRIRMVLRPIGGGALIADLPPDLFLEATQYEPPDPSSPEPVGEGATGDLPSLSFFSLDYGPTVLGFSWGQRWNGFGQPSLEASTLRRWVEETFEEDGLEHDIYFEWRGDELWVVNKNDPLQTCEIPPGNVEFNGTSYDVYDVSQSLCWFEFDAREARRLQGKDWRDCLTAITPPGLEREPAKMLAEPTER